MGHHYEGGKNGHGVYHRLINRMPPHEVYIEPFLGSGALMRLKRPAHLNIGVDLDPKALEKAVPPALSPSVAISAAPVATVELRRRRSARLALPDPLVQFGVGRSRFELFQHDGIAFLESYAFTGLELVYCDPPYVISTRSKTKHGCGGYLRYRFEMADVDHRRFLRAIQDLPCRVMVSGYDSPMYQAALKTWIHSTYQDMTRKGLKTESLWCNFEPPEELHDYSYAGKDYRDRERIKRLVAREIARLNRRPPLDRRVLLAAIADIDRTGDGS